MKSQVDPSSNLTDSRHHDYFDSPVLLYLRRGMLGTMLLAGLFRCARTRAWIFGVFVGAIPAFTILAFNHYAWAIEESAVIDSVKRFHPVVESAANRLKASEGRLRASEGAFDTRLDVKKTDTSGDFYQNRFTQTSLRQPTRIWGTELEAGYRTGHGDFPSYEGKLRTSHEGEGFVAVKIPLLRDGWTDKRRLEINLQRQDVSEHRSLARQRLNQILREARHAYWDWVGNGFTLGVTEGLLKLAEERDSGLKRQFAKGAIPRIQVVDNDRLIFQRRNEMQNALRDFFVSTQNLGLYLRDSEGTPRILSRADVPKDLLDPIPPIDLKPEETVQRAESKRPEFKVLEAKRSKEQAKLGWAKNQLMPALTVRVEQTRELAERVDSPTRLGQNETRLGVQLDLPFWLREARGNKQSAEREMKSLDMELRFLRESIQAQARQALETIKILTEVQKNVKLEYERAKEVERGEHLRFKVGQSDILTINLREEATARAAIRQIKTAIDLHKAIVDLDFLMASLLEPE